jgi:hypothetical protein
MADGTVAHFDAMESLTSLLARRGKDLHEITTGVTSCGELADPDMAAGVGFVEQVWSQAIYLLAADLELTSQRVSTAVVVYEQADRVVGAAATTGLPGAPVEPGGRRPE